MCKAMEDMRNEAAREAAREKMGYLIIFRDRGGYCACRLHD